MSRALLDVNVLLALLDSDHADHQHAQAWVAEDLVDGWASCAITQNGFLRVVSQPRYPSPVSPSVAVALLQQATASSDHEFWPCELSVLDADRFDHTRIHGPRQVTDAYLIALSVQHEGRLVTFDRSIPLTPVRGAERRHVTVL